MELQIPRMSILALCRGSTLVFDWHWQVVVNASRGRNQPFHISRFKNMTNRDCASRKTPHPYQPHETGKFVGSPCVARAPPLLSHIRTNKKKWIVMMKE